MDKNIQNFRTIDLNIDISKLPTPIYIVDERLIEKNLKKLKEVIDKTGCKILLAQKAFPCSLYTLLLAST